MSMRVASRLGTVACLMLLGLVHCGGDEGRRGGIAGTPGAAGQAQQRHRRNRRNRAHRTPRRPGRRSRHPRATAQCLPHPPPPKTTTPFGCRPVPSQAHARPNRSPKKYDLCAGGSDQYNAAACRAFDLDPDNETCLACLFTAKGDAPSGPLIVFPGDYWQANAGGCIALLDGDTTATGCGARTQASDVCRYGICLEACGDSPTSEDWDACRAASPIACISYVNDAACTSLPRYARCRYQSFQEYFLGIGDIFCGTGPDGTGTGGAGAGGDSGSGGTSAPIGGEGGRAAGL